ncbi:MAG: hypothetical protein GY940_11935 [bacterium]|nr:hypothetical protein [bacterium]
MRKKKFPSISSVLLVIPFFAVLLFSVAKGTIQATQRLQPSDLVYMGAFRLPDGTSDVKSWQWGGYAMTCYPGGDPTGPGDGYPGSIYGAGHAWEHQVSEISIPVPVISASKNPGQLNTASTLRPFRDIFNVGNLEMPRTGLAYLPKQDSQTTGKLYLCKGQHLHDESENFMTHGWCELDLSSPGVQGTWYLDVPHNIYNTNDLLFDIPTDWAVAHTSGEILATGRYRDGGWSGQGPSLFAIGPWNQGNPPAPGTSLSYTTLLRYTSSADDESYVEATNHKMDNYHHSDEWSGASWLTAGNKAAVVFVGTKGTGDCWYGNSEGPCLDCEDRGWWSTGFVGQFLFYDPSDLAGVAAGTMESWEPQPYATLNVDNYLYHIRSSQQWYHLGAACFDRANGLFYVFEPLADGDKPIIHVWKVNAGSVTPTITVTSPNGGENWTAGSSQTVTWTSTGTVGDVKIEYSPDNGSSWSTASASTGNDGSQPWTPPSQTSRQYLVRVSETDGSPSDTSDSVFTVAPGTQGAVITLNRSQLNFGAVVPGGDPDPRTVSIDNGGSGTMNWWVTENAGWLSCSPDSGTGAGGVTVAVDISGLSAGEYGATVTVGSSDASNSPQTVAVELNVYGAGTSEPPFGIFSTPGNGTVVSGSVPFTGWALDDTAVESVKIYRGAGGTSVYIGDAVFVAGARPDVERAYPGYPMNYRAGWGYMMLTNFLPNGGNGTFTFAAIATDKEGNPVTLGTKTVTCDNANAVKPFGAIDTPVQGGTASGTAYRNQGWVLTPMPNSMPSDGSTIRVIVDGVDLGNVFYNIFRSDIAGLFPGYANSNGAMAYFDMDTSGYANGVHTIAWSAGDSAGNTDGIGSRYFTVQNPARDKGRSTVDARRWKEDEKCLSQIPLDFPGPVNVKKGFRRDSEYQGVYPDENGVISIEIKESERLELGLLPLIPPAGIRAERWSGYLVVRNQLKKLPAGSSLDVGKGIFYWLPGPGFLGGYDFVFIRRGEATVEKKRIRITITPKFKKTEKRGHATDAKGRIKN